MKYTDTLAFSEFSFGEDMAACVVSVHNLRKRSAVAYVDLDHRRGW